MTKPGSLIEQHEFHNVSALVIWGLTIVSGLLISLSFPPFDLGFLAWFGITPFLYVLRQKTIPDAAGIGFFFGVLFGLGTCYWIYSLEHVGPLGFILWQLGFGLYYLLFGTLYRTLCRRIGSWVIIGAPALWVALEYTRANLFFLSCPWSLMGHSQYQYLSVIQIADITGVYGISFILVMLNQLVSQKMEYLIRYQSSKNRLKNPANGSQCKQHIIIGGCIIVLLFSYGWVRKATQNSTDSIRVALVQGNVLVDNGMTYEEKKAHLNVYDRLTIEAAQQKPDLIVWPATSLPAPPRTNRLVGYTVRDIARSAGAYLLVGGAGYDKVAPKRKGVLPFSNSEYLIRPSGGHAGQYNKMHLLAFNEYVPLQGIIRWPQWITTLQESFLPGEEYTLFHISDATFGSPICSENLYSDHFRRFVKKGAQFMVSATNEGFLRNTVAPYQTLAMNVFRAVENKVTVARAATTGISAFISPSGEILEKIQDENKNAISLSGVLVRDIPLSDKKTFYTRFGDIFAFITIVLSAVFITLALSRKECGHCK